MFSCWYMNSKLTLFHKRIQSQFIFNCLSVAKKILIPIEKVTVDCFPTESIRLQGLLKAWTTFVGIHVYLKKLMKYKRYIIWKNCQGILFILHGKGCLLPRALRIRCILITSSTKCRPWSYYTQHSKQAVVNSWK